MPSAKVETETRQHEHLFEIAASPETVWKAITDAAELVNWFPLDAVVDPGEGGRIIYDWDGIKGESRIQAWHPPEHLRTSWMVHAEPGDDPRTQVAVDWFIEGEGGQTRLRLVHSGFSMAKEWDEEYDGTRRGWDFELYSLKHYLEHHRGKRRTALWPRKSVALDAAGVWKRIFAPDGLVRLAGSGAPKAGDPVRLQLAGGDQIEGRVVQYLPPTDFAFTAANMNNALLRTGFENCGSGPEAHIWVSLWDYPQEQAAALKMRLEDALARTFA